jgi:hypothetical protein
MTKLKVLTFAFVLLISAALLSTCKAQSGQASVKFTGVATGECLFLIEGILGPQPPKAFFIGRGTIAVSGSALANEYPPAPQNIPYTYYLTTDGVKACGVISARGDGQMINAFLYSKGEASGLFVENEVNWFFAGALPGGSLTPSMSYEGIYKDSTGVHKVSGKAAVIAWLMGDPGSQFMGIGAMLFKPDGSPLLSILWTPVDMPLGPGGTMGTLHAANLFMHSVKVRTP